MYMQQICVYLYIHVGRDKRIPSTHTPTPSHVLFFYGDCYCHHHHHWRQLFAVWLASLAFEVHLQTAGQPERRLAHGSGKSSSSSNSSSNGTAASLLSLSARGTPLELWMGSLMVVRCYLSNTTCVRAFVCVCVCVWLYLFNFIASVVLYTVHAYVIHVPCTLLIFSLQWGLRYGNFLFGRAGRKSLLVTFFFLCAFYLAVISFWRAAVGCCNAIEVRPNEYAAWSHTNRRLKWRFNVPLNVLQ